MYYVNSRKNFTDNGIPAVGNVIPVIGNGIPAANAAATALAVLFAPVATQKLHHYISSVTADASLVQWQQ
jgi:hypothetical protein